MPNYFLAFITALIGVYILTPVVMKFALKTGAMDKPDDRKVHKKPIPRIGGLGIYLAFMISLLISVDITREVLGIILGGTFIVIIGIIDDFLNMPAKLKLLGQIVAAGILVFFGVNIEFITNPFGDYLFLGYLSIPATIFWIVGITNTVNLIDGLDGLAAGVSTIATITIMLVAWQNGSILVVTIAAALVGSSLGFLHYNFNPARIFMGDTGSMFLGYMFAALSIIGAVKSVATIALVVPILAIGLPILDTTFAIVRRYRGGVPIFKPDKGHLHHRLLSMGFSQKQAVLLMYVFSAFLGVCAIALTNADIYTAILIILTVLAIIFIGAKKIGILHSK